MTRVELGAIEERNAALNQERRHWQGDLQGDLRMSDFGVMAHMLAYPWECPGIAESGHRQTRQSNPLVRLSITTAERWRGRFVNSAAFPPYSG